MQRIRSAEPILESFIFLHFLGFFQNRAVSYSMSAQSYFILQINLKLMIQTQAGQLSSSDDEDQNPFNTNHRSQITTQANLQPQKTRLESFSSDNISSDSQKLGSESENFPILNKQERWLTQGIGFLQCRWINYNHQIKAISFGTAFAIDSDIILTCAHNVFNTTLKTVCDEVRFFPYLKKGQEQTIQAYCSSFKFISFDPLGYFQKYSNCPLQKDLAVIKLDKFLPFYELVKFSTRPLQKGDKIEVMGYPKSRVKNIGKNQLAFQRTNLTGKIVQVNAHILVHNMDTQNGHSGSPILCYTEINEEWRYQICGIHSHGGPHLYNRGILLTTDIKSRISKLVDQLRSKQCG